MSKSPAPILLDLLEPPAPGDSTPEFERIAELLRALAMTVEVQRGARASTRASTNASMNTSTHTGQGASGEADMSFRGNSLYKNFQVVLHGPNGDVAPLPPEWEETVLRMLTEVVAGHHVELRVEIADEVGTEKLAELLGVSRPTAAALVDSGALPSRATPGGHRRVRVGDVRTYIHRRERQRSSLAALVAHGEDAGLPVETPRKLRSADDDGRHAA